jgi:hypothetical protein
MIKPWSKINLWKECLQGAYRAQDAKAMSEQKFKKAWKLPPPWSNKHICHSRPNNFLQLISGLSHKLKFLFRRIENRQENLKTTWLRMPCRNLIEM